MSESRICSSSQELIEFCPQLDMWLKPVSKLLISVSLPSMTTSGQCISTWEVMQKLKKKSKPNHFKCLKVVKSSIESMRFEAEFESCAVLNMVYAKLHQQSLKLQGFAQSLLVKVAKLKLGSSRHEWEKYFRDNPCMDEMKPGYRPDTIHIQNLPMKWFGGERPSCDILVKVFGVFGDIRRFHIPILDSNESEETFKLFSFNESLSFEAYVQYRDYIGFVKAMDQLKGMKLVKQLTEPKEQFLEYDIKVDFDRTKHLSDKSIKRRQMNREVGSESTSRLKMLKEESRREKELYHKRIKFLEEKKQKSKNILHYLLSQCESREQTRREINEAKEAEKQLKEQLLLQEVKLREKLIEKRREHLRQCAKGKLKSVANCNELNTCCSKTLLYKNHKKGCKFYKPRSIVKLASN